MSSHDELALGIAAAKAGQREIARQHLQAAIRQDPRSELAWLWMSGLVDTPAQRRDCLQRVLALNANNEMARRGMEQLAQSEAASFLSVFEPRTPPPPPTIIQPPPETNPEVNTPIRIDLGSAAVVQPALQPQASAPMPAAAAPLEMPPPSKITEAPCAFCGAPTGADAQCRSCGMEQVFDCPLCSRVIDLRERMICECGQSMQLFIVGGRIDRDRLGDAYLSRDYPGAAVKQWKAALENSPRPALLHKKIAAVYLDLGLIEQARQHNELSKKK
jgi:tetratricopeptide (TPR) repeat protein